MYMYLSGYMKCGKLSQFGSSVLSCTDPQWLVTICALLCRLGGVRMAMTALEKILSSMS